MNRRDRFGVENHGDRGVEKKRVEKGDDGRVVGRMEGEIIIRKRSR